ncbi:MAG: hypothetical protein JKY52_11820 [Flavobacteriales bacterium]|nr:hypothetical protein [Flavobacteriales bacterium]
MIQSTAKLYNEILEDLRTSEVLSKILPSVLILSKHLGNSTLEKWTELEFNSYFKGNKALTDEVVVPEYRTVPGQYHDIYDRPLIIQDPKLKFVNEYRLRHGVLELEKLSESDKLMSIQDTTFTELIKKNFNVEVNSFTFTSTSIVGILGAIRTNLINELMNLAPTVEKQSTQSSNGQEHTTFHNSLMNLHPLLQPVVAKLYADGHYRQAILDAYIYLLKRSKQNLDDATLTARDSCRPFFRQKVQSLKYQTILTNNKDSCGCLVER